MRFSQPFYISSISIISRIDNLGVWGKIKPLFSFKLLIAVGLFLIILAIVGSLFWLAERKKLIFQQELELKKHIAMTQTKY